MGGVLNVKIYGLGVEFIKKKTTTTKNSRVGETKDDLTILYIFY